MKNIDPERLRLIPGESIYGYIQSIDESKQLALFVRTISEKIGEVESDKIMQRAGMIRFNDVLLIVTMLKLDGNAEEFFDLWWNFHSLDGNEAFSKIAHQDNLHVQFYDQRGKGPFVVIRNDFSKFFEKTRSILAETKPWDEIDFDRAVRSVCSQSYPKESLWNSLDGRELRNSGVDEGVNAIPVYKGNVPDELKEFYGYSLDQGHSIRIIPSFLEQDALIGNPEDFLYPAPVKTVLRCGLRWLKGYPVAPIPFIPGVGLAVPPEDKEI
jgi:hypothetical protein